MIIFSHSNKYETCHLICTFLLLIVKPLILSGAEREQRDSYFSLSAHAFLSAPESKCQKPKENQAVEPYIV